MNVMRTLVASAFLALVGLVGISASASAANGVPAVKKACRMDSVHYYRGSNGLFKKYDLMSVCDAGYGAVNVKGDDGRLDSYSRPSSGPLMAKGCIVTDAAYVNKGSHKGCRTAVTGVYEKDGKLYFELSGKVSGTFVLKTGWGVSLSKVN